MSKIEVRKFEIANESSWDRFVESSINGTIFHERKFINYHPKDKFKDNSLEFYEKGNLKAVFPAALIEKEGKVILKSHPGTSYGGLVFAKNIGVKTALEYIAALESYCKANGINQIEFRLAEKIFQLSNADEIDFALLHSGFFREAEELSTCYNIEKLQNLKPAEILARFDEKARNKYKQSLKFKLSTRFIDSKEELTAFQAIVASNLEKHSAKPVHSAEDIIYLCRHYPTRCKVMGIYSGTTLIAGFFIINVSEKGWHIFYSSLDYKFAEMRPINFGFLELVIWLKSEGTNYLNYGISTEAGGKIINHSLFEFKESFAGEGILRTYWMKELEK